MIMSKSRPEHAASLSAECRFQIRSCCVNLAVPYLLPAHLLDAAVVIFLSDLQAVAAIWHVVCSALAFMQGKGTARSHQCVCHVQQLQASQVASRRLMAQPLCRILPSSNRTFVLLTFLCHLAPELYIGIRGQWLLLANLWKASS